MYERFHLLGLSHTSSPVAIREAVAFNEQEARTFIVQMREHLGVDEAMVISTCNRTEIYYSHASEISDSLLSFLFIFKNITEKSVISSYFNSKSGIDAVTHLFEVSLGLDAKVLGDIQISNQVKRAYQISADEGLAGAFLHRLLHAVFYANKRVIQETSFRDGAASASYACVDIANQFIKNFHSPHILILGLGEIGEDVASNLASKKAKVSVANRTIEKAQLIAEQYNYEVVPFEEAISSLAVYDVVISSLAVQTPLITINHFESKQMKHKLVMDLSIPRSVSPEIEQLSGIVLYNIDQIEERTTEIQTKRKQSIPAVRLILDESVNEMKEWSIEMEVSPTIKKLKQALEDIRLEEMTRYLKKADADQIALIDQATKNIIQKVIKLPILQLKAACKRGEAETLVEVLNNLFNLEKESNQHS